jgi:hypothetical protein
MHVHMCVRVCVRLLVYFCGDDGTHVHRGDDEHDCFASYRRLQTFTECVQTYEIWKVFRYSCERVLCIV